MPSFALYDVLHSFKDIHKVVLSLADSLEDEQLRWKPEGYSTSIGFHLWHLARESDYSKYPNFERLDDDLPKKVESVRLNLLVFLTHDCRHLGMMECLKGQLTGFGSATEKRE
jgi:hypothetical protein